MGLAERRNAFANTEYSLHPPTFLLGIGFKPSILPNSQPKSIPLQHLRAHKLAPWGGHEVLQAPGMSEYADFDHFDPDIQDSQIDEEAASHPLVSFAVYSRL
jgi:hypothetical protein